MNEGSGLLALLRRTSRHRGAAVGLVLLVLFLLAAVLAPVIAPPFLRQRSPFVASGAGMVMVSIVRQEVLSW